MDQRDIDRAIKQLREEFAAALKVLEAKIDASTPSAPDMSDITGQLDAHEAAQKEHWALLGALHRSRVSDGVKLPMPLCSAWMTLFTSLAAKRGK